MRLVTSLTALLFAVAVSAGPIAAQGRGQAKAQGPKGETAGTRGGGKPADHPKGTTQTAAPKGPGGGKPHTTATSNKKAPATTTAGTTPTTVTPTTPTTTSVKNPQLEARLLKMLPPTYTNVADASEGFRNWGQFVAAVHVSNNLNIPFNDLKTAMTGVLPNGTVSPTVKPVSLGQAIQQLKPGTTTTTVQTEVQKAETAAAEDLGQSRGRGNR